MTATSQTQTQPNPTADDYVRLILTHIAKIGKNKAAIPIATSFERGRWWLWLDVRIANRAQYEVEAVGLTLLDALSNAHHQLIRQLR